jgi:hypothetical protein
MTSISHLGAVLFFGAVALVFLGILLSIIESIAAWRFVPWAFRLGPRILHVQMPLQRPRFSAATEKPESTVTGRFKLVNPGTCLFRPREPLLDPRVIHTPFPIRGEVGWLGAEAVVEGHLPLGGLVTYSAWVLGVTIWCILALRSPELAPRALWVLLGGWVFATLICWWSIFYELRRARRIVAELSQAFGRAAA